MTDTKYIVVFDGVCVFCNASVKFIIDRDKNNRFLFTPMQTDFAQSLLQNHQLNSVSLDTFLLVKNDQAYLRTDAALEITKDLNGFWYLFNFFRIVPRPVRDFIYRVFARNRYKLFGRNHQCMVPSDELKSKFVGLE